MPFPRGSQALTHLTVLDLTRVRAGPTCARQFADWGANVIRIEQPEDPAKGGESLGGPRDGPDFQNLHRNKRSLALDLKSKAGLAAFHRLVTKADVVLENYRPDVKERLGIDYETLHRLNPRLVYASISGFGQDGPYRNRPGFDQIAQGMGGLMSITGLPGQGPVRAGIAVADLSAGLFAALGVMTALLEREHSGQGQWVQTSLLQAQIFMLDFQAARWLVKEEVAGQAGNNHPTSIPTGAYQTQDGYINIATASGDTWERLCRAMARPELITDPDYATSEARLAHRDALNAVIEQFTSRRSTAECVSMINDAGVPCGPIYTVDQVFADAQVQHLGVAQRVTTEDGKTLSLVGQPVTLSRTPSSLAAPPPVRAGQHTDEVLREFGFSEDEISQLRGTHAI